MIAAPCFSVMSVVRADLMTSARMKSTSADDGKWNERPRAGLQNDIAALCSLQIPSTPRAAICGLTLLPADGAPCPPSFSIGWMY